jgi:hypothetical protein
VPIEITGFTLPGGGRCVRIDTSGHFSEQDAEVFVKEMMSPGSPYHRWPRLVVTLRQTSISSDARRVFVNREEMGDQEPWVAVVITNAVLRVVTNFLMRINGNKKMTLFSGEPEAIQWLDEHTRGQVAASAP